MQWQFLVLFCEFKHFQNDIMGKITSCGFFWGKIYPSVLCFLRCISVALCRSRWDLNPWIYSIWAFSSFPWYTKCCSVSLICSCRFPRSHNEKWGHVTTQVRTSSALSLTARRVALLYWLEACTDLRAYQQRTAVSGSAHPNLLNANFLQIPSPILWHLFKIIFFIFFKIQF